MVANALVDAYQAQQAELTKRVVNFASAAWLASPSKRDADVDRFIARVAPAVRAGQVQSARLANVFVGRAAVLDDVEFEAVPVDESAVVVYRGTPAEVVYRRPAVTTYTALSQGAAFDAAVAEGARRLIGLVSTDLQQARNRQMTAALGGSGYRYFIRYLTGAEDCALCTIASTQRYTRGDLMPIHPGCDCGVKPLQSRRDPGQVINQDLLDATHAEIEHHLGSSDRGARVLPGGAGQDGLSDYTDLLITREHGELGPTLVWRDHKFTGPGDIAD